jgi:hypothetical protein
MKKRNFMLILGLCLAISGGVVDVIPVSTTVGYGCGNLGCAMHQTFSVPSIVLGALVIAVGLVIVAYGLAMDEEND